MTSNLLARVYQLTFDTATVRRVPFLLHETAAEFGADNGPLFDSTLRDGFFRGAGVHRLKVMLAIGQDDAAAKHARLGLVHLLDAEDLEQVVLVIEFSVIGAGGAETRCAASVELRSHDGGGGK